MIKFEITLGGMLNSIVTLRLRQLRWTMAYWARAFGLLPSSGKWTERIAFVYIYLLIIGLMSPTLVSLLNGIYVLETKAVPAFRVSLIYQTIPIFVALISFSLIVLPWRAWMLRLTFGDITYLASSPFDRRILAIWRFVEMPLTFAALSLIPFAVLATFLTGGSIFASAVLPTIARAALAFLLWSVPMLALGWHLSLQEFLHAPPPGSVRVIGRLSVIVAALVLLVFAPEVLMWPGRLIVLLARGEANWGWPLLITYAVVGVIMVGLVARGLSMTRAGAGSEIFARIQQAGFMIFLDRQLLVSILGEARTNRSRAVGVLPNATGILTIPARTALYYRRQYGQAIQLALTGFFLGAIMMVWQPTANDALLIVATSVLLVIFLPANMARVFRADMAVPFVMQFARQPLRSRLLASSIVPCALVLVGMIPLVVSLNPLLPNWAWGVIPVVWVLTLAGHADIVSKGSGSAQRDFLAIIVGGAAVFSVLWFGVTSGGGLFALFQGIIVAASATVGLLLFADVKHGGAGMAAMPPPEPPAKPTIKSSAKPTSKSPGKPPSRKPAAQR